VTAENDPLCDEGEAYGRRLMDACLPVAVTRYNGMIHDFMLLNGINQLPEVRHRFVKPASEFVKH